MIPENTKMGLSAVSEPEIEVNDKGKPLRKTLKIDIVCFGKAIFEIATGLLGSGWEGLRSPDTFPRLKPGGMS